MNSKNINERVVVLVYDQRCPVCESYSTMIRIQDSIGQLKLLDARKGGALVDEITSRGWDMDEGMVLKLDQEWYHGADAIHALSLISSRSGIFNRLNYWVFKHRVLASLLYPILKSCRNLLLKILGRRKINNLELPQNDRF